MAIMQDFIYTQGSATVGEVLRTYLDRDGHWFWILVAEENGKHYYCSFGSLLPYLAGKTPHIEHHAGDCAICTAMDPIFWRKTTMLVESVIGDRKICRRIVSDLPMAELPVVDDPKETNDIIRKKLIHGANACGVRTDGVMSGIYITQTMGGLLAGPPEF